MMILYSILQLGGYTLSQKKTSSFVFVISGEVSSDFANSW